MDELKITTEDIKLFLSKRYISMELNKIHLKISKYSSSNENFINEISELFEKRTEFHIF